jgi:Lrp/AsnC family transcriptional regulator, leucine-responsive regulatory protein
VQNGGKLLSFADVLSGQPAFCRCSVQIGDFVSDKFDQLIIKALQDDARQSVSSIAEQVNLSRSAVSERLKRLEQSGEIRGYQVLLGAKTQPTVAAYFDIQHNSARCADVIPLLTAIPEVRRCHGISGEIDLIVFVQADSVARLHQIREQLDAHPAIIKIKTHIVLSDWINRTEQNSGSLTKD